MGTRRRSGSACRRRSRAPRASSATSASSPMPRPRSSRASARSWPATDASSMPSAVSWLEGLNPWPEEFGVGRMQELLAELDNPQLAYPSIHVVGTNGKTTTTRRAEALLSGADVAVGAYTSPHVGGWSERIRVRGVEADLER